MYVESYWATAAGGIVIYLNFRLSSHKKINKTSYPLNSSASVPHRFLSTIIFLSGYPKKPVWACTMSLKRKVQEEDGPVTASDCQKRSRPPSPAEIEISMWQPPPSVLPKSRAASLPEIAVSESVSSISSESGGVLKPHDNDVLCRRGGRILRNPGNIKYRKLIDSKKKVFRFSTQKLKPSIAMSVVDSIYHQEPPGRFLQQDTKTGQWFDIGKIKAIQKTNVALGQNRKDQGDKKKANSQQAKHAEITDTDSNGDDQEEKYSISDCDEKDEHSGKQQNMPAPEDSFESFDEISELTNEDYFVPLPYCKQEEKSTHYDSDFVSFMNNPHVVHALFDGDSVCPNEK